MMDGPRAYHSLQEPRSFSIERLPTRSLILPEINDSCVSRLRIEGAAGSWTCDSARPSIHDGGLYSDDAPPTVAYRYSNEYARFVWMPRRSRQEDIMEAVRPSLKAQMRPGGTGTADGYGYTPGAQQACQL